jgi:hypothetical protein
VTVLALLRLVETLVAVRGEDDAGGVADPSVEVPDRGSGAVVALLEESGLLGDLLDPFAGAELFPEPSGGVEDVVSDLEEKRTSSACSAWPSRSSR